MTPRDVLIQISPAMSQNYNPRSRMSQLTIRTHEKRFPTAPHLYGLFFEDINRAGDGGLYAELLRNRSFEDSVPPSRCSVSEGGAAFTTPTGWVGEFNGGEGRTSWLDCIKPSPVPGWHADSSTLTLDDGDTLNDRRLVSLLVDFNAGGSISNDGFRGVPLAKGNAYAFYMFVRAESRSAELRIALTAADGRIYDQAVVEVAAGEYLRYDLTLTAPETDADARLSITAPAASTVRFGFTSLMPADTYRGHGLRSDLVEMLAGLHPAFLRFPGGCIVEGFTRETAIRFPDTIGPVWERPSHHLMWSYRTTNGLGFHEYLQLCEDLDIEAIYVLNCGMTCQTRGGELFDSEEVEELLQEAFAAIEYAVGDTSTPMGEARAAAGHPEPFRLAYVEIGNENFGSEYEHRYEKFYEALHARYPTIRYISNTHTEEVGLPTDIVDEHFYDTADFFAEHTDMYDAADREGPKIFLGEYAVNAGMDVGNLRAALGEAMFLLGIENNQDVVQLTAYAPLLENVHYVDWSPNLIAFDNHRSYGIPGYHALSMLAAHRGDHVVASTLKTDTVNRQSAGAPGIVSVGGGLQFRNARVNGAPVELAHELQGRFTQTDDVYTAVEQPDTGIRLPFPGAENLHRIVAGVFGTGSAQSGTFEVDIKPGPSNPFTVGVWCSAQRSGAEGVVETWTIRTIDMHSWTIDGNMSRVTAGKFPPIALADDTYLTLDSGADFHRFKVVTHQGGFDCYVNDLLVQEARLPAYPSTMATAAVDDDSVIIKIVNIAGEADEVNIDLDESVANGYDVTVLSGARDAANSLDSPQAVVPVMDQRTGAAQAFSYVAPPYSFNILVLKRLKR